MPIKFAFFLFAEEYFSFTELCTNLVEPEAAHRALYSFVFFANNLIALGAKWKSLVTCLACHFLIIFLMGFRWPQIFFIKIIIFCCKYLLIGQQFFLLFAFDSPFLSWTTNLDINIGIITIWIIRSLWSLRNYNLLI